MSDINPAIYFSLFGILPVACMIYYLRLTPDQRGTFLSFVNPADRDQGPMLRRALLRGRPKEETEEQRATRIAKEDKMRAIENERLDREADIEERKIQEENRANYMNTGPLHEEDEEPYRGGKKKKTRTKQNRASKKNRKQSHKQRHG